MEIKQIPIIEVSASPMNPRKTFVEADMQELAANIDKQGLLQPITVRPIADPIGFAKRVDWPLKSLPHYEIVCGERRFRAFSSLSVNDAERFKAIPAIVREMSDAEAFDAMITENLQRKDVDPIEEAYAFSLLIKNGSTPEDVALRFGKSIRFVQDRVKLNNLIPELMLAVREGRMSLSAAMMIAKLDEEVQKKFHSQCANNQEGFSKRHAEYFLGDYFMTLSTSNWTLAGEPDFEGGCGRKCSECVHNSLNHGCLFWEMKGEEGKCTNRGKFMGKLESYLLHQVDKLSDRLVKEGEPLTFGGMVVAIPAVTLETYPIAKRIQEAVKERGFMVVDPLEQFKSRCYYGMEDERTQAFLEDGTVYRCLQLMGHSSFSFSETTWYLKKDDETTNVTEDGQSAQVIDLVRKYEYAKRSTESMLAEAGAKVISESPINNSALEDEDMVVLLACMLIFNRELREKFGIPTNDSSNTTVLREWIVGHREQWPAVMRAWMLGRLGNEHPILKASEPYLDSFGERYCPDEYKAARDKVTAKQGKVLKRIENELKKLGYDTEGNPITEEPRPLDATEERIKAFHKLKAEYPDAVLLFRVGDFYECFNEDAKTASETIGLTLTNRKGEPLCGFPHHALDTYLPKLIRAGKRVAVIENLKDVK